MMSKYSYSYYGYKYNDGNGGIKMLAPLPIQLEDLINTMIVARVAFPLTTEIHASGMITVDKLLI